MKWTIPVSFLALTLALSGCGQKAAPSQDAQAAKPKGLEKLIIEDVKLGKGSTMFPQVRKVQKGDIVFVHYTGTLKNGIVFDSNMSGDQPPFGFRVGNGDVIQGWDQGLVGMTVGGERKLSIPAKLAYGEVSPTADIPANSDLYFTIKLLDMVNNGDELVYDKKDITVGKGKEAKKGSTITFHYEGLLCDLSKFDSSVERKKPITIQVGVDKIQPKALDMAIVGMKVGGKRAIRIPPDIGLPPSERVPQNSLLYFMVELLDVK